MKLIMILSLLSFSAFANIKTECAKLSTCLETFSKLTGQKYFIAKRGSDVSMAINIEHSSNMILNKENAEEILSAILYDSDLARIDIGNNTFRIVPSRDITMQTLPEIRTSLKDGPNLPNTYDFYQMQYTFENGDEKYPTTDNAYRTIRPFLSREGRIIQLRNSSAIIIIDCAKNLKRIYSLLKQLDVRPTTEMIRNQEEQEKMHKKLKLIEAKSCPDERREEKHSKAD